VEALDAGPDDPATLAALLGRIRQCSLSLGTHRAELVERGANLNTTFQLARLEQQLARLALLSRLRQTASDELVAEASASIVKTVLQSVNGARLFRQSSDLLVQNLVDTAANVGRAYIDEDRSAWRAAFFAGAGGGVLMAGATLLKFFLMSLHLPTIYEGIAYSLNYGAAFCAAYLLHFTIATKLPAQTAAALARSVQAGGGHGARLRVFGDVWRRVLRVLVAGLVGNVVVVGPLCFLTDLVATHLLGHHLLSATTAHHVLSSNSALSPSALYAALTGLFLWMSSLIGASGDNWSRLTRLADRLATNRTAMKRLNPARARSLASGIADRAGGLLGNMSLGFMLGAVPAAFAIFSLPVEIRHVTVSTGSVALAVARGDASPADIAFAWLGVLVIGLVNLAVSFLLALGLALRATNGMRISASANALVWIGLRRHTFRKTTDPGVTDGRAGRDLALPGAKPLSEGAR
jgi:site-specific recombinase